MGKTKKAQKYEETVDPAPVTPESADVQAAAEAERKRLQKQRGRANTYRVNPAYSGQFVNSLKTKTGD